jgi:anti-sigma regulatory factor (Ser/Thr protein kinase)
MGPAVEPRATITLSGAVAEVSRLHAWLDSFWREHTLPAARLFDVKLALEEVVVNVMTHGYGGDLGRTVEVRLAVAGDGLAAEVIDDGPAFDPRSAPTPDLSVPIEARPAAGLGLHLVRAVADGLAYARRDDRNHVALRFRMDGMQGPPRS